MKKRSGKELSFLKEIIDKEILSLKKDGYSVSEISKKLGVEELYIREIQIQAPNLERNEVLYLCDRRACPECLPECKHTTDISHAENFEKKFDIYVEKEVEEVVIESDKGTDRESIDYLQTVIDDILRMRRMNHGSTKF